jgi:hypothetical protein
MAQMPDIKTEVNKESEKDKKKAGLFARLFGGSSSGGALATGGYGSAAVGGGMMATKAGLLALILVGTTVAGGIGLVGYRLFGPGQDAGSSDNNTSLFATKPKEAPQNDAAPKDGSSASLKFVADANVTKDDQAAKDAAAAAAAAAAKDASSKDGDKAKADASAAAATKSAQDHIGDIAAGNGVSKAMLKPATKFGNLSAGASSGGGMGGTASVNNGKSAADVAAQAGKSGNISPMRSGRSATGGSGRAVASRRMGAMSDLMGVRSDLKGAQTSYQAGRTYDNGTAAAGSNIGPEGGQIGMAGPGQGGSAAQPKSMPNTANQVKELQPPPTPTPKNVAPWQNAIQTAQMLIAAAIVLLFIAKLLNKTYPMAAKIIGGVVAVMAAMVIALGAQIASGPYHQTLQGGLLAAAGVGMGIMAFEVLTGGGFTEGASDADSMTGGLTSIMKVGGVLALLGVAGTMMMPPQKYPSSDFQNGNPPDAHWFGMREVPSDKAVKQMLA